MLLVLDRGRQAEDLGQDAVEDPQAAAVIRADSLSEYQPGHEVWVKHDPKQPGRVALYNP